MDVIPIVQVVLLIKVLVFVVEMLWLADLPTVHEIVYI